MAPNLKHDDVVHACSAIRNKQETKLFPHMFVVSHMILEIYSTIRYLFLCMHHITKSNS